MTPLIVKRLKPRNPVAQAARRRNGGRHRSRASSHRQAAMQRLRNEMKELHPPPPRPDA